MAISPNYGFNPTVDQLLRQALQLAGLVPLGRTPSGAELAHARDHMNTTAKSLSAQGACLTQIERETLPLVAGQASYTLAADTLEVSDEIALAVSGQTSQTWIQHVAFSEYQRISNKTSQGTPTLAYIEKQALVTLVLWPVPDQIFTISYQRQRLIRDMDAGSTIDQSTRWMKYWTWQMAFELAVAASLDVNRCKMLEVQAEKAQQAAFSTENERVDLELVLPRLR